MLVSEWGLVADSDCCADGLLAVLRYLPGVFAVLGLPLSNILFASARGRVREYRRAAAGSAGREVGVMDEVSEGLSAGRETLDAILREVRAHARCRHVVLHDDRAFAFPLADASGIAVIELVRETVADRSGEHKSELQSLMRIS